MKQTYYLTLVIIVLSIMIIFTRAVPFIFGNYLKRFHTVRDVGKYLPGYIMLLLVIYEIKLFTFNQPPYGIPAIVALLLLTMVHWYRRNAILSIAVATFSYLTLTAFL